MPAYARSAFAYIGCTAACRSSAARTPHADAFRRAMRRHFVRDGLNLGEARMLHRILSVGPPREPSNPESVAIRVLINAGLIAPGTQVKATSQPPLEVTEEVRVALLLDGP